ncbi:hypothetical protein GW932_00540 [archaeon]|nr:hypothetical protein [archaeon]
MNNKYIDLIYRGIQSFEKGFNSLSYLFFPEQNYKKIEFESIEEGFQKDKEDLASDWKAVLGDFSKIEKNNLENKV